MAFILSITCIHSQGIPIYLIPAYLAMMPPADGREILDALLITIFSRILAIKLANSSLTGAPCGPLSCNIEGTSISVVHADEDGGWERMDLARPWTKDWKSALRATKSVSLFT